MARRRVPRAEDPRIHILDAALRAFAREGYAETTIRDIASEAEVASGLLYHYFPNKQAILSALFERSASFVARAFSEAAAVPQPRARLAALLQASARLVRENLDFWRVSYGVRFQGSVLEGVASGRELQSAAWLSSFAELLGQLGHPAPEIGARLLFATLDGVFQHYVLDPEQYPLDSVLDQVLAAFGGGAPEDAP